MSAFLNVDDLCFSYGGQPVLNDINFQLSAGEIVALLGESGCGKTSLLRLIAGFATPSKGTITLDGEQISSPTAVLSPEKRGLGMMFQDYALFPHLSVSDNIAFGLNKAERQTQKVRVGELLDMVGLPGYENRYPHELSGGQQQRISMARALAPKPRLLLMDEPFASLDANLRERLVRDLGDLLKHLNISAVLVTHDQREAFAISSHVGLMHAGQMLHWGTPYEIYHEPASPTVANFVGQGVMMNVTVATANSVESALGQISSNKQLEYPTGKKLCMLVRPDDVVEDVASGLVGCVQRKFFHGATTLYEIGYQGMCLVANLTSHANYEVGQGIHFSIQADHLVLFDHPQQDCVC